MRPRTRNSVLSRACLPFRQSLTRKEHCTWNDRGKASCLASRSIRTSRCHARVRHSWPFEDSIYAGLRQLAQLELPREAAAALAAALQGHLAGDAHGCIPYSQELELLMRAVLAILKGGDDPRHIAVKLRGGVFQLVSSLYGKMPGFAARVSEDEVLQAVLGDYHRPVAR